MNRTLLVLIGLACALVSAAGIMWYNNPLNTASVGTARWDPFEKIQPHEARLKSFSNDIVNKEFICRYNKWAFSMIQFYPNKNARVGYSDCTIDFGTKDQPNGKFGVKGYNIRIMLDATKIEPFFRPLEGKLNELEAELIGNNLPVGKDIEQLRRNLEESEAKFSAEWAGPYILYESKTHYFLVDIRNLKDVKLLETLILPSKEIPSYY